MFFDLHAHSKLDTILYALRAIQGALHTMAVTLQTLTADVQNETVLDQSIINLLNNIAAELKAAGTNQAALDQLHASITANSAAIADAIKANTPVGPTPNISGLSPTSGPVGTSVVISGSGFGGTQATTSGPASVSFNGTDAGTADSWTDTSISVKVPAGATSGDVIVSTGSGKSAPGTTFSVG